MPGTGFTNSINIYKANDKSSGFAQLTNKRSANERLAASGDTGADITEDFLW